MRDHKGWVALVGVLSVAALWTPVGAAATTTTAPAPAKNPQPKGEWPRKITMGDMTATFDEPQAESLEGTKMTGHGGARIERAGETEPSYAEISFDAQVEIDRTARTVTMASVNVSRVQLPGAPPARQQHLAARFSQVLTRQRLQLPLDDVLASVKLAAQHEAGVPKLNTDPPKIVVETEPAILIVFDGEPRFRLAEGSKLERALNTPFLVLHDPARNVCYLNGGTMWFSAPQPTGPWAKEDRVPSDAVQIATRDLKEAGVASSEVDQAKQTADKRVPKILVATEPTELVVLDGPPKWSPAVDGELEAISNSESDVFRTLPDQKYWIVLSGRWYRSDAWSGPWTYVSPDLLPTSFHKIPSTSPKASVLTFVPGTASAREALTDETKPRTAAIKRSDAHVAVTYDGDPRFEQIAGTHVEYALNSPDQVMRIRGKYYVCDKGVWFTSASATGPWAVADSIPEDDIQAIPPESPVYNTRYAYVYDSSPDLVYMAYTPAYLGSYPWYGTVVFGTGWFYRPWWGAYYYPRPWTWGFHAMYAPWAGWGWGFGWGPAWAGFRYGFGFGWGARWCGPGGFYRPAFRNVNITRNVNVTRNVTVNRNLYASNRAAVTSNAAKTGTSSKPVSSASKAQAAHTGAAGASHTGTGTAHAKGASPQGAKAKTAPPKAHASGKGGAKKH
jgi:hypothetical protein